MAATGVLFYDPRAKPLSTTGTYQPGCYLYFYTTGTTTQTPVYADGALTTPLSQPVTAASDGRFAAIYMNPATIYRVQMYTAGGTLLEDTDPFVPGPNLAAYVTNSALASTLAGYVTSTSLTTTLGSYATTAALASYMPLAGGTFTGTVNGITPATSDNSTKLATTAFAQALFAASGYLIRVGSFNCINGTVAVNFATPFPHACDGVFVQWAYAAPDVGYVSPSSVGVNGFSYVNGNTGFCYYVAFGT